MVRMVGPAAFTAGVGQVVVTAGVAFAAALGLGLAPMAAFYVAAALTFSSTIIVVKLLSDKREIDALHGRLAVGLLIVQDLAVILVMIGLTALGSGLAESGQAAAVRVAVNGIGFVIGAAVLARWVLPGFTSRLAVSPELLVLFGIAWAIALAAVSEWLGLSREVGALVAGVSLASTPFRDALAGRLVTVRDFLLLFFFIDLGTRIDLSLIGSTIGPALALSALVLVGKPAIVMVILGLMGYRKRTGFMAGLTMGQISEFSLILATLGLSLGHIDVNTTALVTTVGLVTITVSTYLINAAAQIYARLAPALGVFERRTSFREGDAGAPLPAETDVILFGLGRYGSGIARHLRLRNRRVIGVDFDPQALARWRAEKLPVVYGDVEDAELFRHLPLDRTKWVVGTTPEVETNRMLLHQLQQHKFRGKIALACRTAEDADTLRLDGADVLLRPFADAAEQAVDAITSGMDRLTAVVSAAPGLREVRLGGGSMWAGWRLGDVPLRNEFGVTVLAVSRSGRSVFNPGPHFQLFPGDHLILTGEAEQLASAVEYMGRVDFPEETEEEPDFLVEEVPLQSVAAWHGQTLAALDLRKQFDITVIAVRQGERLSAFDPHRPLAADDHLVVAGRRRAIEALRSAAAAAI